MIEMVIALAIVGAVAGVIAGLFGVGGGMILVPAFYYAFTTLGYAHQDLMQICLATSLATIVVTSLRSLVRITNAGVWIGMFCAHGPLAS